MIRRLETDVVVLGAGPAGLAAACSAMEAGARVVVVEREERTGGILKQCIHDGFGLLRYGRQLSGRSTPCATPTASARSAAALCSRPS